MISRIEHHRDQIETLCRKHSVKRLELFGSAASGKFRAPSSDIDFLVEFESYESPTIADQWFGLQADLERLLGSAVDLTSLRMATDPDFLAVVNQHRVTLYAA